MRKYIYAILLIMASFFQTSCFDALDIDQESQISSINMWNTEEDGEAATYGMYYQFRSAFSSNIAYWGDYRTGVFSTTQTLAGDILDASNNTIDANNQGANWGGLYKLINTANLIIRHVPTISFSNETNKNRIMANAYFVRAFAYYWVVRIWGDAPLLLDGFETDEGAKLFAQKSPSDSIYKQVESDIDKAVELIPSSDTDNTVATPSAINMLKADYCMWMAKVRLTDQTEKNTYYTKAQEALTAVLSNSSYSLADDYSKLFDATNKKSTNEIIFTIRFVKDEYEGGFAKNYLLSVNAVATKDKQYIGDGTSKTIVVGTEGSLAQRVLFTTDFINFLFANSKDKRAQVTYPLVSYSKKYRWINKYIGSWINQTRVFNSDIIVYRLADAILFQAELYNAIGETDKAISYLNKIALRAYGISNYYKTTLSSTEVDKYIMDEREKEFAAECKIWWDMIRMGVVFDRVKALSGRQDEANILLWPISYDSLNSNPNLK